MAESQFTQVHLSLRSDVAEAIKSLHEDNEWSKAHTVGVAVRALQTLMKAHRTYADQYDDDVAKLYLRLAADAPAGFVEVPKDGVEAGRVRQTGRPAVLVDGWTVTAADDGELVGLRPVDGGFEMATVADGVIRRKAKWSPEEAEAALAAQPVLN